MAGHMDRKTRGWESIRVWASWPLLARCPLTFAWFYLPWVAAGVAHPPRPLGSICRAEGDHDPGTFTCSGGSLGHRDRLRVVSDPTLAQGAGVQSRCTGWGWPAGLGSRLQSGLASEQLGGQEGPRKEKEKRKMKSGWLKYSVSLGVG